MYHLRHILSPQSPVLSGAGYPIAISHETKDLIDRGYLRLAPNYELVAAPDECYDAQEWADYEYATDLHAHREACEAPALIRHWPDEPT